MFYVTGDKHAEFFRLQEYVEELNLTEDDTIIVLGDFGYNYFCLFNKHRKKYEPIKNSLDLASLKLVLDRIPCQILVVQGNHEAPAWLVAKMEFEELYGGAVYYNPEIPHIKYLLNGQIYQLDGKEYLVMGGAYSVDVKFRKPAVKTEKGLSLWFPEEQMTDEEFELAEKMMESRNNKVHGILSHTCPRKAAPVRSWKTALFGKTVDSRMEDKFDELAEKFDFDIWYFGHFHVDEVNGKYHALYHKIEELT